MDWITAFAVAAEMDSSGYLDQRITYLEHRIVALEANSGADCPPPDEGKTDG